MEKNKKISCFLAHSSSETMALLMAQLPMGKGEIVDQVFFLAAQSAAIEGIPEQAKVLQGTGLLASDMMLLMAKSTEVDYVLFYMKSGPLTLGYHALERMIQVAEQTGAAMVYADHSSVEDGKTQKHPVIDYQLGSIRDDFDFGSVVLLNGKYFLVDSRTGASHTNLHIYNVLIDALLHISAASFHLEELLIQSRNHP